MRVDPFRREVPAAEREAALAAYREAGWALLPGVASESLLGGLRERADALVAGTVVWPGMFFEPDSASGRYADLTRVPGWVGPDTRYRKLEKLELDPLYRAWIENPLFAALAIQVLGPAITLYRAVLFWKAPRLGSEVPWHQDGGRMWGLDRDPVLQIWTALDDAPPEAGCLEVLPGSHHGGLVTPLGAVVPAERAAAAQADARARTIPARAGDVVLLHNQVWHRSGPNTTHAPRRAFTVCFLDAKTRCVRTRRTPRSFLQLFKK